jgi:hypothetical protein
MFPKLSHISCVCEELLQFNITLLLCYNNQDIVAYNGGKFLIAGYFINV